MWYLKIIQFNILSEGFPVQCSMFFNSHFPANNGEITYLLKALLVHCPPRYYHGLYFIVIYSRGGSIMSILGISTGSHFAENMQ